METAVNAATPEVDIVEQAQALVETNKQAVTDLTDQHKVAKQTLVDYKAALKALPEGDENIETGKQAVADAEAAEAALAASLATAKTALKESKEAVKTARATKREQVKAAKAAEKAAKDAAKEQRVEQNGMKHPLPGSVSGRLWAIFDAKAAELQRPPAMGDVFDECVSDGTSAGTTRSAYAHWRKFHGLTGRIMSEADIAAAKEKADEKARKEQERAAKKAEREAEAKRKADEKAAKEAAKAAAEAAAAE